MFCEKTNVEEVYAMVLAITLIGSQQCSSVLANDIAQIYSGVTQNTEFQIMIIGWHKPS